MSIAASGDIFPYEPIAIDLDHRQAADDPKVRELSVRFDFSGVHAPMVAFEPLSFAIAVPLQLPHILP